MSQSPPRRDASVVPIIDGHNDVLLRLSEDPQRAFFARGEGAQLDGPRAIEGGWSGGMFAVFVSSQPAKPAVTVGEQKPGDAGYQIPEPPQLPIDVAWEKTRAMMEALERMERESDGRLRRVTTAGEIEACIADRCIAASLHFEGAEAIRPDLGNLEELYDAGLRSIGLTWSRPNAFAYGVPFVFPHSPDIGPGLTDEGRALVHRCNRLGILLDLSHLNEQGFWDVARMSDAPLVATHSGVHAICPVSRNLTDAQLAAIAASNGIVGIPLTPAFLRPDGRMDLTMPIDMLTDHIDYIASRVGVEHVGIGTDFEGARMPEALPDAAALPRLIDALKKRGHAAADIDRIAHGNWLRVLKETWRA